MLLEEVGLNTGPPHYIGKGEQFAPEFVEISPTTDADDRQ